MSEKRLPHFFHFFSCFAFPVCSDPEQHKRQQQIYCNFSGFWLFLMGMCIKLSQQSTHNVFFLPDMFVHIVLRIPTTVPIDSFWQHSAHKSLLFLRKIWRKKNSGLLSTNKNKIHLNLVGWRDNHHSIISVCVSVFSLLLLHTMNNKI